MNIFLTGMPGVGKTTCLQKVVETVRKQQPTLTLGGFYTQERRCEKGIRAGFDIICYSNNNTEQSDVVPLAQIGSTKPKIGKYSVCLENIQTHMVESLLTSTAKKVDSVATNARPQLTVIDEVGKMELLYPEFFPTVWNHLNNTKSNGSASTIGTLPLPKKPIRQVQQIMGRKDVLVLLVTKSNRDRVAQDLSTYLLQSPLFMSADAGCQATTEILNPYIFRSSNTVRDNPQKPKTRKDDSGKSQDQRKERIPSSAIKSCPALVHKKVPPKILLLGETASPLPENDITLAYKERSMWKVLAKVVQPSENSTTEQALSDKDADYRRLQDAVLSHGIAIWDVLSNVHEKKTGRGRARQGKRNPREDEMPNDLVAMIDNGKTAVSLPNSIQALCFIGSKAHQTFIKHFLQKQTHSSNTTIYTAPSGRRIDLVLLPSSSTGNRMPLAEKAAKWNEVFDKYGCGTQQLEI